MTSPAHEPVSKNNVTHRYATVAKTLLCQMHDVNKYDVKHDTLNLAEPDFFHVDTE